MSHYDYYKSKAHAELKREHRKIALISVFFLLIMFGSAGLVIYAQSLTP